MVAQDGGFDLERGPRGESGGWNIFYLVWGAGYLSIYIKIHQTEHLGSTCFLVWQFYLNWTTRAGNRKRAEEKESWNLHYSFFWFIHLNCSKYSWSPCSRAGTVLGAGDIGEKTPTTYIYIYVCIKCQGQEKREFRTNCSMKCRNFGDSGHVLDSRGTQSSCLSFLSVLNGCPLALLVACFSVCIYYWATFPMSCDFSGFSLGHRSWTLDVSGPDPESAESPPEEAEVHLVQVDAGDSLGAELTRGAGLFFFTWPLHTSWPPPGVEDVVSWLLFHFASHQSLTAALSLPSTCAVAWTWPLPPGATWGKGEQFRGFLYLFPLLGGQKCWLSCQNFIPPIKKGHDPKQASRSLSRERRKSERERDASGI